MTQNEIAKTLAEQVQRDLVVERIRGWQFPERCDLGVTVISSDGKSHKVKARLGNTKITAKISETDVLAMLDFERASERLVAAWLAKNGTGGPVERRGRKKKNA